MGVGVGVLLTREGSADQGRILVDAGCFGAGGFADTRESKLDFNRTVNGG